MVMLVFPVLDHRFGWSPVPASVSVLGDVLIALGFLFIFFVFRENSYGASTIQVTEGQTVIATGPYAFVRHPMYAGALVMPIGTPLARLMVGTLRTSPHIARSDLEAAR